MSFVSTNPTMTQLHDFVEDYIQCILAVHNLSWVPILPHAERLKIFNCIIGCAIAEDSIAIPKTPSKWQFNLISNICLKEPNVVANYVNELGWNFFRMASFSWESLTLFLAFIGLAAVFFKKRNVSLMVDEIILHLAVFLKRMEDDFEQLGGWQTFSLHCTSIVMKNYRERHLGNYQVGKRELIQNILSANHNTTYAIYSRYTNV